VISDKDIEGRVRRLDELARGMAKECVVIRKADDPLLYLERKAYLTAIQNAIAGVEAARVVLARVCQRLAGQRRADRGEEEGAA
jgi:hypothetical protein